MQLGGLTFWTRYDKPWKDKIVEEELRSIEKEIVVGDVMTDDHTKGITFPINWEEKSILPIIITIFYYFRHHTPPSAKHEQITRN